MRVTRRRLLALAGAGALGLVGLRLLLPRLMRHGSSPDESPELSAFLEKCFAGIDRSRLWDAHVHLVGLGTGGTGCRVDPEMLSHLHPIKRFQFDMYMAGAGITDRATADAQYVARLLQLQRAGNPRGKLVLFAFDAYVDESGLEHPEHSPLYVPNEYMLQLVAQHPELVPCASIHPYRTDCVERLETVAAAGARCVKWLPNAMGIDPGSALCDAFYRRLTELRLPLICHAGREDAVDASLHQDLGNPLRLRRALDAGVRVVVAHCASRGSYPDLERDGRPQTASFDLFMRLFGERSYEQNLFGDISTLTHVHHDTGPLRALLRASGLHRRLLYGSDYPLPALRFMISPTKLQLAGLLEPGDRRMCGKLFALNPLLFDFAVSRCVRLIDGGTVHRFSDGVFETSWLFDARGQT